MEVLLIVVYIFILIMYFGEIIIEWVYGFGRKVDSYDKVGFNLLFVLIRFYFMKDVMMIF